jgi:hypothetical protein
MKHQRIILSAITAAIALTAPLAAQAESDFNTGAGPVNVSARVNFSVIIPKYAFIRVGTGTSTPMDDNATVNTITVDFKTAPDAVGNLVERAATAGSGDIGNGAVTVQVRGNNGDMVVAATTPGRSADQFRRRHDSVDTDQDGSDGHDTPPNNQRDQPDVYGDRQSRECGRYLDVFLPESRDDGGGRNVHRHGHLRDGHAVMQ